MRERLQQTASKALRSTVGFASNRIAANDRLMTVVYDLMNETNFAGLSEHEEMLNDTVRVGAYHQGIHQNVTPGDVVVDVGTGTGLLAMMASRAGAKKVYAVEHSDFIEVARDIARHNGFDNIEFVQANSREFTPPEPVDVVLHEQMGDELFNENMVENLLDMRRRVLRPGGRILPAHFALFVEPVSFNEAFRVRRFWNTPLPDGIDLSAVRESAAAANYVSDRAEHIWARPGAVANTIGDPEPVIEFDLHNLGALSDLPTQHTIERTAATDGIIDGFCVWFEAGFGPAATPRALTTSPLAPLTSWGNRVFRLDREVNAGEVVHATIEMASMLDAGSWSIVVA